jgi:hypothetical protein
MFLIDSEATGFYFALLARFLLATGFFFTVLPVDPATPDLFVIWSGVKSSTATTLAVADRACSSISASSGVT